MKDKSIIHQIRYNLILIAMMINRSLTDRERKTFSKKMRSLIEEYGSFNITSARELKDSNVEVTYELID